ncbi:hypothetical protein [Deinococcus frigens]|uniref:hypothetical protein n=1 Tax=Deinococcus frigens TaxID=249403 RepID=UPI0012EC781D|nr:hypothetical protein [Deinococcus frigens]
MPLDYLKRYRNLRVVNEVSEDELIKSLKEPENIFDRNTPYRKAYNTFMWIGVGFGGLGGILGYFTSDNFSIVLAIMLISMVFIATALIPHFLFERNKQPHIAYQSRIVMGEMFDLLITA